MQPPVGPGPIIRELEQEIRDVDKEDKEDPEEDKDDDMEGKDKKRERGRRSDVFHPLCSMHLPGR